MRETWGLGTERQRQHCGPVGEASRNVTGHKLLLNQAEALSVFYSHVQNVECMRCYMQNFQGIKQLSLSFHSFIFGQNKTVKANLIHLYDKHSVLIVHEYNKWAFLIRKKDNCFKSILMD